jgi:hypothetical protein
MMKRKTRSRTAKPPAQEVEASGVVMTGECTVRTAKCQAMKVAPITAVWTLPGRIQIDVCGACLHEKLRVGDWHMEGTRRATG